MVSASARSAARRALGTCAALVVSLGSAAALGHERWVPNTLRFPINRGYFQRMSGEVLLFSVASAVALFGTVFLFYLVVPPLLERLSPATSAAREREARRGFVSRMFRLLVRLVLDDDVGGRFMNAGLAASAFAFSRIPALVLGLGAYQGWLVMPSFPLYGPLGDFWRIASVVLALWVLIGVFPRVIGAVFFAVFGYLIFAYGIAAIDAIPVLASAFFYVFASKKESGVVVNSRQLLGIRVSLGVGFFLLGLVNKILLAELFIGVADNHPAVLAGPQAMLPGLTRETWSFTTALGEMVFGLLLLTGVFNRLTTVVLSLVFANFVFVFGWPEVVHVYPILGFVLLFFRGNTGTLLDGLVFRANLFLWTQRRKASALGYASAVGFVAAVAASLLMWVPLVAIIEIAPHLTGLAVPAGYIPPPLPPPARLWNTLPPPPPHSDHTPRHGGVVTMSGDLHIELVVTERGAIHLYFSDAARLPIPASEAAGAVLVERPGSARTFALLPEVQGSLFAKGPRPRAKATYTYDVTVRGTGARMSLEVPEGGTAALLE